MATLTEKFQTIIQNDLAYKEETKRAHLAIVASRAARFMSSSSPKIAFKNGTVFGIPTAVKQDLVSPALVESIHFSSFAVVTPTELQFRMFPEPIQESLVLEELSLLAIGIQSLFGTDEQASTKLVNPKGRDASIAVARMNGTPAAVLGIGSFENENAAILSFLQNTDPLDYIRVMQQRFSERS